MELQPAAGQLVKLEELAAPFSRHLCDHLKLAETQGTNPKSRFLDACRQANSGELSPDGLVEATIRFGFDAVIKAFHRVGSDDVPRFFVDERRGNSGIRMTDEFSELIGGEQFSNLPVEAEARWRLVETAWDLGITPALLAVSHDPDLEELFVVDSERRRRAVTGARDALSGYQKGHCFHCSRNFSLLGSASPDVDHFFPHSLKAAGFGGAVDGVWNLVLACRQCNRGIGGTVSKSNRVPTLRLLERLSTRNEFLIRSHHPLRETLMQQTGASESDRREFLNAFHTRAVSTLIHQWEPAEAAEPLF